MRSSSICIQSIPNYLIIIIYSKLFNYYLFILIFIFVEPSLVILPFKLWTNHSSWLTHFLAKTDTHTHRQTAALCIYWRLACSNLCWIKFFFWFHNYSFSYISRQKYIILELLGSIYFYSSSILARYPQPSPKSHIFQLHSFDLHPLQSLYFLLFLQSLLSGVLYYMLKSLCLLTRQGSTPKPKIGGKNSIHTYLF